MNQNRLLYLTVFLTGAGVLIIEVAAVRVLTPFYGSSLYVFSAVLTTILTALSLGYWFGGQRSDKRHSLTDLFSIITLSGVLVLLFELLTIITVPLIASALPPTFGPLVFAFGLFFLPAFLLGMVSPYVIKLQSLSTDPEHIGSVVGGTFFWGTVGSILGSIAAGFWLIPFYGVQNSIVAVGLGLVLTGLIIPAVLRKPLSTNRWLVGLFITAVIVSLISLVEDNDARNVVFKTEGIYSSITVSDTQHTGRPMRLLNRDTNNSSAIFLDGTDLVFSYTRFIELYQELVDDPQSLLVLGGGAYTVPRTLSIINPELAIDVVEIEPKLFEIAQTYFDYTPTENTRNFNQDARVFLSRSEDTYDIIFSDLFSTDLAAPFHLSTVEFYQEIYDHLSEDGVLILNYVGRPKGPRPSLTGSMVKTITSVFPNAVAYGLNNNDDVFQNIIFIASKGERPIDLSDYAMVNNYGENVPLEQLALNLDSYDREREILLTDDFAPVSRLMAKQK
ncbi:MAG: fused MFS/spermidine synthase [Patescibacteria group bacterium]